MYCRAAGRYVRHHAAQRYFHVSAPARKRVNVSRLTQENTNIDDVEVNGWIRTVRKQKRVAFAAIDDGTSLQTVQAVMQPDQAANLAPGTAVKVSGSWQTSMGNKQSHELQVKHVQILGDNDAENHPIQPKYQTREFLRTVPHLRSRIANNALLLRLRSQVIASVTRFFADAGFVQTHTPVITSSDCEGAGEVFSVTSGAASSSQASIAKAPAEDFFRSPKYLTVSAQLHLEALAQSVGRVWTLSPTFRAEKSDTPRHLSEFYMLEAEMCFTKSMDGVMDLVEDMLRAVTQDLTKSKLSAELLQAHEAESDDAETTVDRLVPVRVLQERWQGMMADAWPRVTYATAMDALLRAVDKGDVSFDFAPSYDAGFQAEHERYLAKALGQGKPVFITNYPRSQKPFYMPPSSLYSPTPTTQDETTAACFDLLVPDLCELVGGSMREHRLSQLDQSMTDKGLNSGRLEWYRDLRRFGSVPHGGFGLGFDRLLCYLGGVNNVRDVVAFPRWHGRCEC